MFQEIEGKTVYVVDLQEMPPLPVHDGGNPALEAYALALTKAIRSGVIKERDLPGKFGVEVDLAAQSWTVYRIDE